MDLNGDCLTIIFEHLDLKDQISAAMACRHFFSVLSKLWKNTYEYLYLNFDYYDISEEELNIFIKCITETVEEIHIQDLTYERLAVLKLYSFPNVRTFRFTHCTQYPLVDRSVLAMTEIFPKLRSFSPSGTFSGKNMGKFLYLKDLKLTHCPKLKFNQLETILEELLLTSLQLNIFDHHPVWTSKRAFENFCDLDEIFLNTTELAWLSYLWKFKYLKKLTIADRNSEQAIKEFLENLCLYKISELLCLQTNSNKRFFPNTHHEYPNLKMLLILNYESCISTYLTHLKFICPNLCNVIFKCCKITMITSFNTALEVNNQIEYLSIEECKFRSMVFKLNVEKMMKNRTKQFHFNFCGNYCPKRPKTKGINPVKLKLIGSSPLLEITEDLNTHTNFEPLIFKFQ